MPAFKTIGMCGLSRTATSSLISSLSNTVLHEEESL